MDPVIAINERVEVFCYFKTNTQPGKLCIPYKMQYSGRDIVFTKLGLRHPTAQGKRMIHVFDMHDGTNDYRLEFDAEGLTWTLRSIIEGDQYALRP